MLFLYSNTIRAAEEGVSADKEASKVREAKWANWT